MREKKVSHGALDKESFFEYTLPNFTRHWISTSAYIALLLCSRIRYTHENIYAYRIFYAFKCENSKRFRTIRSGGLSSEFRFEIWTEMNTVMWILQCVLTNVLCERYWIDCKLVLRKLVANCTLCDLVCIWRVCILPYERNSLLHHQHCSWWGQDCRVHCSLHLVVVRVL